MQRAIEKLVNPLSAGWVARDMQIEMPKPK
jgi:hypothetical protein